MPTLTITASDLFEIVNGTVPPSVRAAAAKALARPATAPRGPQPGAKGHVRCVHHEPIALPNLTTPVLCFDVKPTAAQLRERVAFATYIDKRIAAHHAAEAKRPAADGKLEMDGGKRLAPHAFPAWAKGRKPGLIASLICNPKPRTAAAARKDPLIPRSKFTGPKRRWRKGKPLAVADARIGASA